MNDARNRNYITAYGYALSIGQQSDINKHFVEYISQKFMYDLTRLFLCIPFRMDLHWSWNAVYQTAVWNCVNSISHRIILYIVSRISEMIKGLEFPAVMLRDLMGTCLQSGSSIGPIVLSWSGQLGWQTRWKRTQSRLHSISSSLLTYVFPWYILRTKPSSSIPFFTYLLLTYLCRLLERVLVIMPL